MTDPAAPPPGRSPRAVAHVLVLLTLFSLWTWKLLEPHPVSEEIRQGLADAGLGFAAAKSLHAAGYALLTVLVGTLPAPRHWRYFLVGLLALHGVATEVGQSFVPNRHGRYQDVLIDWAGIAAGVLVVKLFPARSLGTRPVTPPRSPT